MSKATAPADEFVAAPLIESIRLKQPHTHAGRDYPAGAVLELALLEMSQQDAAWLIALDAAERA